MIDMRAQSRYVEEAAAAFDKAQAEMNRAKAELDTELYRAFASVCLFKAGDRISYAGIKGRAVILRNNTQLGLYLDKDGERYPIPEPYTLYATKVKTKKA